jgi:hypothetical protein
MQSWLLLASRKEKRKKQTKKLWADKWKEEKFKKVSQVNNNNITIMPVPSPKNVQVHVSSVTIS